MLVSRDYWEGRRVLLTGHTGFKGAWLSLWLSELGAQVTGVALAAETPSMFDQIGAKNILNHIEGDVRDADLMDRVVQDASPQTVFHLAAQPIVRLSYEEPRETFATNVQGTAHVLDACRRVSGLEAIVAVTSDKCYQNNEWIWPYRESDPLGGYDPYSASKAAAEIVIGSYRQSFFSSEGGPLLASVRAGNVIGGGDWAADRLVPDIIRAIADDRPVAIRSPHAIRPWQHVLEALGGYLLIAQHLADGKREFASAWNFGPSPTDAKPVSWIVNRMIERWGQGSFEATGDGGKHEAGLLKLDCSKAYSELGWRPAFELPTTIDWIIDWHKAQLEGKDPLEVSRGQLSDYMALMESALQESEFV